MKEVRRGLYIGDANDAEAVLRGSGQQGITHLLSLLSFLPQSLAPTQPAAESGSEWHHHGLTRCWLSWHDTLSQNILDALELCLHFIAQALEEGSILVHCLAGVSRSAAVVIAYLMKSERSSLEVALSSLRNTSIDACPNDGFLEQLRHFETMGFMVDQKSQIYKKFHAKRLGESFYQGKNIDTLSFVADPALSDHRQVSDLNCNVLYHCKKCRRIVASHENVLTHNQETGTLRVRQKEGHSPWDERRSVDCTSVFVEPMQWMTAVQEGGVLGKLACANCNARLGRFNWAGVQCSCGTWVVPAFQLHQSRLDASKF